MKRFDFKNIAAIAMMASMACTFTACSSDDNGSDYDAEQEQEQETALQAVNEQFVDATVIPTYKALADECLELQEAIENMNNDATLAAACTIWKNARQYWEWSEAFLFGAATSYGIDPHIDTWPFDITEYNKMTEFSSSNPSLLGFHGLEYIIFRNGQPRAYADLSDKDKDFANSVAEDLAICACHLEAAWAGIDNVSAEKQQILEDAEEERLDEFGYQMKNAGKAGSTWRTVLSASIQILEGGRTIVDEVASKKIGAPHTGEDVNYIESPYSYNSIQDFYDNIVSVRNAYYGGLGATSIQQGSLAAYLAENGASYHTAIVDALNSSLSAINNMVKPFVLNYTDASAGVAIDELRKLDAALLSAETFLQSR